MNTLFFVKFPCLTPAYGPIVFYLTATDADSAAAFGRAQISEHCVSQYGTPSVEPICQTPDVVVAFEPV